MNKLRYKVFQVLYWLVAAGIVAAFGWMYYLSNELDTIVSQSEDSVAVVLMAAALGIVFVTSGAYLGSSFLALNICGFVLYKKRRIWYAIVGVVTLTWCLISIYALINHFSGNG